MDKRGQQPCAQSYGTRSVPTTFNVYLFLEFTIVHWYIGLGLLGFTVFIARVVLLKNGMVIVMGGDSVRSVQPNLRAVRARRPRPYESTFGQPLWLPNLFTERNYFI